MFIVAGAIGLAAFALFMGSPYESCGHNKGGSGGSGGSSGHHHRTASAVVPAGGADEKDDMQMRAAVALSEASSRPRRPKTVTEPSASFDA